ncbi:hypothetical protein GCM10012275_56290 [Longimycelium tulufanense]|uniref:Uncharacterized protein n=1 Tax=Longimycelium tulufanense TaxID=907463 RepID=A0A8J3CDI6_9PSEU|nr:hypothetical protein [Longimycelium tulufanense]GGM78414.1 hypothetical protein GCM10012275_56290 [Longimycelium tulufanense]
MKVTMLTAIGGPEINHAAGETVEFDDKVAQRLVAAGLAEPAAEPTPTRKPARRTRGS